MNDHKSILTIGDPYILAIPIIENHEPFVDLKDQTILAYGPSPEALNNKDYTKVRKTVYDKLIQAQALLPDGLKFCLYEGYRSLWLQKILFDGRCALIKELHPQLSEDEIYDEACKMVSPVIKKDGSKNIPPHSTGGAIDIYLTDASGKLVPMGIETKDWMEDKDGSLSLTASKVISTEAQANRKTMGDALKAVGFVNYPHEYWHWSYGDRYWAYHAGQAHAIYGSVGEA